MGWLSFLSGKTPEDIEKKGDALMADGLVGHAKIEYENARHRHEKKPSADPAFEGRIETKIRDAREALADEHVRNGRDLIDADCPEDAAELLELARELTGRDDLKAEIGGLLNAIDESRKAELVRPFRETDRDADDGDDPDAAWEDDDEDMESLDDEEYLDALLAALPPEEQDAYEGYGETFLWGFVALNRGEFDAAAEYLSEALEENADAPGLIPLELATCYLNMGRNDAAREILEPFLAEHPEVERAYPLVCESLWGLGEYDRAARLLEACPEALADSMTITILKGETLVKAGKLDEAEAYYQSYIDENGRNEFVVRALAEIHKTRGEAEKAMPLYAELVSACTGCGRRADPELRRSYADAAFDAGHLAVPILELYLGLAREDPANRAEYFGKVSRIYASMGNESEAERFEALSREDAAPR